MNTHDRGLPGSGTAPTPVLFRRVEGDPPIVHHFERWDGSTNGGCCLWCDEHQRAYGEMSDCALLRHLDECDELRRTTGGAGAAAYIVAAHRWAAAVRTQTDGNQTR